MNNQLLKVRGTGKVKGEPDYVEINVSLEARDYDYENVIEKLNEKTDTLRNELVDLGFNKEDLKTTNFSINTEYTYVNNKKVFNGYTGRHDLKFSFDFDMDFLNQVLTVLGTSSSNPSFNVYFTVKDKEKLKDELLVNSIDDAKRKALIIADAAGVNIGRIVNIDYNIPEVRPMSEFVLKGSAKPMSLDITPADIELTDSILIEWELLDFRNKQVE